VTPRVALADGATVASNNATVQPGGPRSGANGKDFFNIEGSSNDPFDSFGVVDFQFPTGSTFNDGDLLSLTLAQANASFTTDGSLTFYLTTDTTADIEPDTSTLLYDSTDLPSGLGDQLSTRYLLGTGAFTRGDDGQLDTFTFAPTDAALISYLMTQISTGGTIRLIIAPDDPTVAATYAGFSNADFQAPGLSVGPVTVPERD
jgi:hypothetical protein